MAAHYVRHILEEFRCNRLTSVLAAEALAVSRRRVYDLLSDYLRAFAKGRQEEWVPRSSGGAHKGQWPAEVEELLSRRLSSKPPSSYAFAASESDRLCGFKLDRSQVRRWAIEHDLGHGRKIKRRAEVRRWQRQQVGELWQMDSTPHVWFPNNSSHFPMINMLDDCSRLYVASKIYERETLLAYLDFLPEAFLEYGFPLAIYVDFHSMFFSQQEDSLTELGRALHFYGVTFRYAPTPQAKGKIERAHQYWQARLPALFVAEHIDSLDHANQEIEQLRGHRNQKELHREIQMTPQAAWDQALKENRSALRKARKDAWWPFVWSHRRSIRVGDDGRVSVGNQRIRIEVPPRTRVVFCEHPTGHQSFIAEQPNPEKRPIILFSNLPK